MINTLHLLWIIPLSVSFGGKSGGRFRGKEKWMTKSFLTTTSIAVC